MRWVCVTCKMDNLPFREECFKCEVRSLPASERGGRAAGGGGCANPDPRADALVRQAPRTEDAQLIPAPPRRDDAGSPRSGGRGERSFGGRGRDRDGPRGYDARGPPEARPGDWSCGCGFSNFASRNECRQCGAGRS
jgi:hypothetical protein